MAGEDLYEILGVEKGATLGDIKKAYRRLARELHPDRTRGDKASEERFKKVTAAYTVLSDPKKRALYDEFGADGLRDGFDPERWRQYRAWSSRDRTHVGGPAEAGSFEWDLGGFSGFGGLEDIFESLFGRGRTRRTGRGGFGSADFGFASADWPEARDGVAIRSVLEVDLLDAVIGRELEIVVPVGKERRRLKVKLPAGVEDGQVLRLRGQGGPGRRGGAAGDLMLEIRVRPDPVYTRHGMDLEKKEAITVGQAFHGATVPVTTPWGKVKLGIPQGTQGGQRLRLKGQGVRTPERRGDLYVEVVIRIPERRDAETVAAVNALESRY